MIILKPKREMRNGHGMMVARCGLSEQWVRNEIGGVVAGLENIRISQPACHDTNAMGNDMVAGMKKKKFKVSQSECANQTESGVVVEFGNIDQNQVKCKDIKGGGRPPTPTRIMVWWLE